MAAASSSQDAQLKTTDKVPLNDPEEQTPAPGSGIRSLGLPTFVIVLAAIAGAVIVGFLGQAGWSKFKGPSATILETIMLENKPSLDKRDYQYSKFSNGIEVLNIKDGSSQYSGFSVAVQSGSYMDGEFPGLAHFCEHMLFLGTEKYPSETGFHDFMTMHGGYNNAYTADEVTVYFGKLDKSGFAEGLDRFADFFRAPLFNPEFTDQEVHAIGSEHSKNIQSPGRRTFEIMKSLANPQSPVSAFHTGNVETLIDFPKQQGTDIVTELRKYYKANYCAPRFRVVTFGPDNVQEQLSQSFSAFSDLQQPEECAEVPPKWNVPVAYHSENLGHFLHVKAVQPQSQLWTFFSMPDLTDKYTSHPTNYLRHVLGYSGEHSLEYVLKEKLGLAMGVSVMADPGSAGTSFYVIFELTPKGSKNIDAVVDTMFMYINSMRERGVDMELYESIAAVGKLHWQWSEMSDVADMVSDKAEAMTRLSKNDLLSGDAVTTEFDEVIVKDLMDLLTPSNMNMGFIDPDFDTSKEHLTLPYYSVQYTKEPAKGPVPSLENWDNPEKAKVNYLTRMQKRGFKLKEAPQMKLPEAIQNIPDDINLESAQAPLGDEEMTKVYGDRPSLVNSDNSTSKMVWYRKGSTTGTPKMLMKFTMRKEDSKEEPTAREALIPSIFSTLFEEGLGPKTVDLQSTGISYSLGVGHKSLSINFGGFKHNLPDMMKLVMDEFTTPMQEDQERFNRVVQDLKESLQDESSMPSGMAMQDRNRLIVPGSHSKSELLEALNDIKMSDVTEVGKAFVAQPLQVTNLVMGNINAEEAQGLQQKFEEYVKTDASVSIDKVETIAPVINPKKNVEVRKINPRKGDTNSVTTVTLMYGVPTDEEQVTFGILGQVLAPLAFGELRTNQQLGYVVQGGVGSTSNVLAATVIVQGDAKTPDEIEPQIEMVMTKMMIEKLESMTSSEFQSFKDSYLAGMLDPPLGLNDEVSMYWTFAARGGSCPHRLRDQMDFLRNGLKSKDQLIEAWKNLITPTDGSRSRIVVKYFPSNNTIPDRPSKQKTLDDLKAVGVPQASLDIARKEYDNSVVLNKVDTAERQALQRGGSMFPQELKCDLGKEKKKYGWVMPKEPEKTVNVDISAPVHT